jgi:hypothetical protein
VYHQLNVYQVLLVVASVQIAVLYSTDFVAGLAVVHQFELNVTV